MNFRVPCPPYNHEILFSLNSTSEARDKFLLKIGCQQSAVDSINEVYKTCWRKSTVGNTRQFDNGSVIVRMDMKVASPHSMAILYHEIFHGVCYILRRVGIECSEDTEEAYAYLLQHVNEEVLKRVAKQWWK